MTTPISLQDRLDQEAQAHKKGGPEAVLALRKQWEDEDAAADEQRKTDEIAEIGRLAKQRLAKLDQARKEGGEAGYQAMRWQLDEEDRQAAQAKRDEARRAAIQTAEEAEEAAFKAEALQAWLRNGGDEATFEQEWPALRVEAIRRKTLADMAAPRRTYNLDIDF